MRTKVWLQNLKIRDQSEEMSTDGSIILKYNCRKKIGWEDEDWMRLTKVRG